MENEIRGGTLAAILHEIAFRRAALAQLNRIIADCPHPCSPQMADELRADIERLELASRRLAADLTTPLAWAIGR